jgi:hypothetical protein
MRKARFWIITSLCLCLGGAAVLEGPARTAAPIAPSAAAAVKKEVTFEARLDDESVVRVRLLCDQIHVTTPYGRLFVPVTDIQRIEFGYHSTTAMQKRIREAVAQLAAKTYETREGASKQLLALGPVSYSALRQATNASDLEVVRRAKSLVEKMEAKCSPEQLQRKSYDLVHTPTFTIAGQIEGGELKVRTSYFGETRLKLANLIRLRSLGSDSEALVTIDSARYANPGAIAWMETEVEIREGARVEITASGQIDMYPLGGYTGQWMATAAGPGWGGGFGQVGGQMPGVLIGRIGKNGKEIALRDSWSETASNGGRLYLRIVPSPWGNASTGTYKVAIRFK